MEGILGSSGGKESACNVGDLGLIPGLGRFPRGIYIYLSVCTYTYIFLARPHACRILVSQPGIEPGSMAVETWSPNYRTAREFPPCF